MAVINEGIGGNRIHNDAAGTSALTRFDRDGAFTSRSKQPDRSPGHKRHRFSANTDVGVERFPTSCESLLQLNKVSAEEMIWGLQQVIGAWA